MSNLRQSLLTGSHMRQRGLTLVECLMSLVLSAMVMAALAPLLTMSLQSYTAGSKRHHTEADASIVMRRIAAAINQAHPKKKQDLVPKDSSTSGKWLDGYDPVKNQAITFRYEWSAANRSLQEIVGSNAPVTILTNVTHFSVEQVPTSSDIPLLAVTLTAGTVPEAVTLKEYRRLGGAW